MPELGLEAEDILLIDRSLAPKPNDLVVVTELDDAELKITRFDNKPRECELWGVAQHIIRTVKT